MTHLTRRLASTLVLVGSLCAGAELKIEPVRIVAEPIAWKPGTPLSPQALVTQPPVVQGALSWTIESRRHRGSMRGMCPSPDGKQLVTSGIDYSIRIWNLPGGELARIMLGHTSYPGAVAWSPCGNVIASSGAYDATVRIWDARTGHTLKILRPKKSPVGRVAWSPDAARLALSTGDSGSLMLWTVKSDELKEILEVGRPIHAAVWSPDARYLAVCAAQSPVSILDIDSNQPTRTLGQGMGTEIFTTAAWSPDAKTLVTGCSLNATLWNVSGEKAETVKKLPGECAGAAWSPDGKQLITTNSSQAIQAWDIAAGKTIGTLPVTGHAIAWHPPSNQIFAASYTTLSAWKPASGTAKGEVVASIDAAGLTPPLWTLNRPIVTGLGTSSLNLWDATTGKFLRALEGLKSESRTAAWSRDGNTLAVACNDKSIRLWDAKSGEPAAVLQGHAGAVLALAWAPSGKTLASAAVDKTVRLWDDRGQCLATLEGHAHYVSALAWAPLGNMLASGSYDQTVRLWNVKSRQTQLTLKPLRPIYSLAFTSLGKNVALACGTADSATVYNAANGQTLNFLPGGRSAVVTMAWLANQPLVAFGRDRGVGVWDPVSNKIVRSLTTFGEASYVSCSSNGGVLIAGAVDRTVRFWDAANGDLRAAIVAEPQCVALISFDGHWRADAEKKPDLIYVVLAPQAQAFFAADDFAARFRWKNNPARVRLTGR